LVRYIADYKNYRGYYKKIIMNIFSWYFSQKALPYWGIFLLDCFIVFFSNVFVCILNNGIFYISQNVGYLFFTLLVYLLCYVVGFRLFRTYSGVIRYSSFVDLQRVGFAILSGLVMIVFLRSLLPETEMILKIRLRDVLLSALLATLLMWAVRVIVKYLYDSTYQLKKAERVFIYGVRQGGMSIAKSICNMKPSKYILSGFVSDESDMDIRNKMLMGVHVFANDESLIDEMKSRGVNILLVSPLKSESLRENQNMVNSLTDNGIRIFMIPSAQEWDGKSEINHNQLREVEIEDLLPREKIEVDMDAIGELLTDKRILVTGAAGSIGSEMVRQVAAYNPQELILIDQAETPMHDIRLMMKRQYGEIKAFTIVADIANKERMREIFSEHKPEYVFHAAAYKHVPMMEDNPSESIQNNVEGTRIIANLSVEFGAKKFVMISTDKAVNPTNVMGCSKRICEIYVQSLDRAIKEGLVKGNTQFVTTRFGNVLGSNGSVIPLFKEQIKNGGPITVTHPDIIRFFMLIPEACKLVLEAGTMGNGGEIFVFDMGKPVKIVDLAKRMIRLSRAENIEIKFTGLRDGEKLYEEVLNEEETTLPTFHPKIKIAKVREYEYALINNQIDHLVQDSFTCTDMEIVGEMKKIVPEFKSQHSVYEVLDK